MKRMLRRVFDRHTDVDYAHEHVDKTTVRLAQSLRAISIDQNSTSICTSSNSQSTSNRSSGEEELMEVDPLGVPHEEDESSACVQVHPMSNDPDTYWHNKCTKTPGCHRSIEPLPLDTPVREDMIRVVCISDTHNCLGRVLTDIPPGHVLIHAGDFTFRGSPQEVKEFNAHLAQLPHAHKLVIAGNHELSFDPSEQSGTYFGTSMKHELRRHGVTDPRQLLTHCTYLEDSAVELYGYKFYGAPWQPDYGGWAFNESRGADLLRKWKQIDPDTDVLITHGPPVGHGDTVAGATHAGCVELLNVVERSVRPLYHVFGHIHEAYGVSVNERGTTFVNACVCTERYNPTNKAIIFDLPRTRAPHANL